MIAYSFGALLVLGGFAGVVLLSPVVPSLLVTLPLLLSPTAHASADIDPGPDRPAQVQPANPN